jgi:hypothetical protein
LPSSNHRVSGPNIGAPSLVPERAIGVPCGAK